MSQPERVYVEFDEERFELLDELDNIPIVDSFVKENKTGLGAGEARLYVGARKKRDFAAFFEDFSYRAFFLKADLADYLKDAKFEYENQEQHYQKDISADWKVYETKLRQLSSREYFSLESALGEQDTARFYIRSHDPIFREYFRSIMLPSISYVSILKLRDARDETFFLFRPVLSYSYNPYYHPAKERKVEQEIELSVSLPETQRKQLVQARIGQGRYRQALLDESSECVITRVNDERVLVASHIKPWSVSNQKEKIDHNNGLMLTPTYDRLFDQGFISFQDDGTILISAHISPLNVKKLGLSADKKYILPSSDSRLGYLAYHRENIYKG